MLKFNEQQQIDDIQGALELRPQVEKIVDEVWEKGYDNVFYLGIGGTYASAMQAVTYINGRSDLPVYVQHAAEYYTTGNRRLTKDSLVILSSVTGTTEEVVKAVDMMLIILVSHFSFSPDPPLWEPSGLERPCPSPVISLMALNAVWTSFPMTT